MLQQIYLPSGHINPFFTILPYLVRPQTDLPGTILTYLVCQGPYIIYGNLGLQDRSRGFQRGGAFFGKVDQTVKNRVRRMGSGGCLGPSGVPGEVWEKRKVLTSVPKAPKGGHRAPLEPQLLPISEGKDNLILRKK